MSSPSSRLLPHPFDCIKVRRVFRKEVEFDFVLIGLYPLQNRRRLMPLCIVSDEVYSASLVSTSELFEKFQIRRRVEDFHKSEMKLRTRIDTNSTNNLDTCPGREALDLRPYASSCPVPINGTGLSEQNLIFIQQHAVFPVDFFLLPAALS